MSREDRHEAAKIRVTRALFYIQEAQNNLGRASSAIGSVCYGGPRGRAIQALYDKVHAEWYRVNALLADDRIELDREPDARDLDTTPGRES